MLDFRVLLCTVSLLASASCGGGAGSPGTMPEPDFYGKQGQLLADALKCDWRQIPIEPGSPNYDIPPTDQGLCTFADGKVVGLITWPNEKALLAGVEVTPGAYSDYPAGDYYLSYGRGWLARGDDNLDRESAERPLQTLKGTLGYFGHLGNRTTPSPVPYPAPT